MEDNEKIKVLSKLYADGFKAGYENGAVHLAHLLAERLNEIKSRYLKTHDPSSDIFKITDEFLSGLEALVKEEIK
jgi:hypothetical protein